MSKPQWVKLFLVPQTDNNNMPPFVIGLLNSETVTHYVLNPMLNMETNEDNFEPELVDAGMNFISKTYVWRCQVLGEKPNLETEKVASEVMPGGLG